MPRKVTAETVGAWKEDAKKKDADGKPVRRYKTHAVIVIVGAGLNGAPLTVYPTVQGETALHAALLEIGADTIATEYAVQMADADAVYSAFNNGTPRRGPDALAPRLTGAAKVAADAKAAGITLPGATVKAPKAPKAPRITAPVPGNGAIPGHGPAKHAGTVLLADKV